MKIQKLLLFTLIMFTVSFSQKADTTSEQNSQSQVVTNQAVQKKASSVLNKTLVVRKNPTTWTLIKDLFM